MQIPGGEDWDRRSLAGSVWDRQRWWLGNSLDVPSSLVTAATNCDTCGGFSAGWP
jgi:hypothetical protein